MMENLSGKRLLILGGGLWKEAIKKYAEENEIVLIAAGNDPKAGFFEIAAEKYEVDSTDSEVMRQLIKEKNIDGVYLGGNEQVMSRACVYLEEIGLPCYTTKKQWDLLSNKANLKELFMKYDIPVVPRYDITPDNLLDVPYPVITKPVDGSGSNGFSVCHNRDELIRGYQLAKDASFSGDVLVEKFVPNDSVVVVVGRVIDGEFKVCTVQDKYSIYYEKQRRFVGGLYLYESNRKDEIICLYEHKIRDMLRTIGVKEAPIWFEVFYDKDKYYFNEAGFRYGGTATVYPVQYFAGINEVASDIYYALTGKTLQGEVNSMIPASVERGKHYCAYPLHIKPGTVASVSGVDKLNARNNVVVIPIGKRIGSHIPDSGTFAQVFGFVHFIYENTDELISTIKDIHNTLCIADEREDNLLSSKINLDTLLI